ncbi:MAG: calcium-binding protein [Nitrosomonas sp.]|nr:calcium-binding protein [Nitrosomonas sp.]
MGNSWDNQLTGNNLRNHMRGNEGNDVLKGLGGDDGVVGGEGNDTLYGDAGNDSLWGEAGTDVLYGGLGADQFFFSSTTDSPNSGLRDTIVNFKSSEDDQIVLAIIDADASTIEDEAFALWQIDYNSTTQILTADVLNSSNDFSIKLTGLEAGFDISSDIWL